MEKLLVDIEATATPDNDNVEVEVTLPSGVRYWATFFTMENIRSLFEKNARTGENASGTYFRWASNMIIVKTLTREVIERTIMDLVASERFETTFLALPPQSEEDE
jgi:hypothetical protein